MDESQVRNIVQSMISASQTKALYSTTNAASHTHNGVDSPKLTSGSSSSKTTTGFASRALGGSTATQTIAHNFGSKPSYLRITGFLLQAGAVASTIGTFDGTTMNFVSVSSAAPNWGAGYIVNFSDGTNGQNATVTLSGVDINLSWTKVAAGLSGQLNFIWECS